MGVALDGLAKAGTEDQAQGTPKVYGVALAYVIDNCDRSGEGRVQVRLPWLKGVEPWARVAVPMAGSGRGTYFMPQDGDEVLVAFENGDTNAPYIVGALWNAPDRVPVEGPEDAKNKQMIRTREGHEIVFDGSAGSITITSARQQRVTIGPAMIEMKVDVSDTDLASLTLDSAGRVTITAKESITLTSKVVSIHGTQSVDVTGDGSATIDGGKNLTIKGVSVSIN